MSDEILLQEVIDRLQEENKRLELTNKLLRSSGRLKEVEKLRTEIDELWEFLGSAIEIQEVNYCGDGELRKDELARLYGVTKWQGKILVNHRKKAEKLKQILEDTFGV